MAFNDAKHREWLDKRAHAIRTRNHIWIAVCSYYVDPLDPEPDMVLENKTNDWFVHCALCKKDYLPKMAKEKCIGDVRGWREVK